MFTTSDAATIVKVRGGSACLSTLTTNDANQDPCPLKRGRVIGSKQVPGPPMFCFFNRATANLSGMHAKVRSPTIPASYRYKKPCTVTLRRFTPISGIAAAALDSFAFAVLPPALW